MEQKKDIIDSIKDILLKHGDEKPNLRAWKSAPPVTTRYCLRLNCTDTYTLDGVTLNDAGMVLVYSSSAFERKTDNAENLSVNYLCSILRFLQRNEEFIWTKESPSAEESITVTLSATQQRYLCGLLCGELDSAKNDLSEGLMDDKDAAVLQAHIEFLEETLNTLKV